MTAFFLDSSALVKRYIVEVGTGWVQALVSAQSGNTVLIAQITPVEIVSAMMRRHREGTISSRAARAVRILVDRHASREYMIVGVSGQVVQRAETLLETYPLRAYDSVQLASAVEVNRQLISSGLGNLIFVLADIRLLGAAVSEGLIADNPNAHP